MTCAIIDARRDWRRIAILQDRDAGCRPWCAAAVHLVGKDDCLAAHAVRISHGAPANGCSIRVLDTNVIAARLRGWRANEAEIGVIIACARAQIPVYRSRGLAWEDLA